ncbi:unnamed protein product [Rotaria magnacalcarata]|uniref:Uncharacterized protein n=2 Tax=Rotaria magnacalcarata TaxID=392030 RepID=A0A814MPS1_9BILA|nr:unnamed protein product [Rotaria magnacalcarata]
MVTPTTDAASNYVFYKPSDYYNQLKKSLQLNQQHARDQSTYSHMDNKKYYDKNRSNPRYKINENFLLRIHGLRSKLDPQFTLIPKIAIQKQHPTYWVRDQMNDQITRVHVNDMRPILLPYHVFFWLFVFVNHYCLCVMPSHMASSSYTLKNSNRDSSGKSQDRHRRHVRLEEQNNRYQRNYRPFTIPSSFYNIVHVHRFTTIDTISTLINHFESLYRYSIDTESDQFINALSLIQVHSIPQHLSSFIVLFELNHLPSSNTLLFEKNNLLFRFLFRSGNTIFAWGSMNTELQSVIHAFPGWYSGAQPFCKVCCPVQLLTTVMSSNYSCTCSNASPYLNPGEKWSLQNAMRYTANFFLDKSATRKNWSMVLDPNYSSLSSYEQRKRIYYAIYDCVAVTFLHQAIYDKLSLIQLREAELISLFTSNAPPHSSSLSSSSLLKHVSEYQNANESTSNSKLHAPRHSALPFSSLLEDISDEEDEEILVSSLSRHNGTHPLIHPIRPVQIELAILCQLKHIIRQRDVRYVHLKLDKSSQVLSIGLKRSSSVDLYFDRLPGDLFDKKHYYQHRQHEHRYY